MIRMINGEVYTLTPQEEAKAISDAAASTPQRAQRALDRDKTDRKETLIREKVESLLTVEFAQIDAAKTKSAIEAVNLSGGQ